MFKRRKFHKAGVGGLRNKQRHTNRGKITFLEGELGGGIWYMDSCARTLQTWTKKAVEETRLKD
jgi:hypothetical protein